MFDLFGTGAKAQVEILKDALAIERKRNEELTEQLIALVDARAHRALHPLEPSPAPPAPPARMRPLSPDAVVGALREEIRLRRPTPPTLDPAA